MSKAKLLTPKQLKAIQTVHENHLTVATPNSDEVLIGKLLSHIQALQKKIKAADTQLVNLTYRHECLKMMYSNEKNYLDDDLSVDLDIGAFISEEQS